MAPLDWTPIAISLGAISGALSRYYLSLFCLQRWGDRFPYGTLLVNLTGAFMIGLVAAITPIWGIASPWPQLIVTGYLGAYTTFSTYILDSAKLLSGRQLLKGLGYWLGSATLGLLCVELGLWLGRMWG